MYLKESLDQERAKMPQLLQDVADQLDNPEVLWKYTAGLESQEVLLSIWAAFDGKRIAERLKGIDSAYADGYRAAMQDLKDFWFD